MSTAALIAKAAAVILSEERGRKAVGWILVAVLSPLILLIAVICSFAAGGAEHNNATVEACFYGASYSGKESASTSAATSGTCWPSAPRSIRGNRSEKQGENER